MPEFVSKVQHKNFEKGEFSAEKRRSLNETLQLIRDFPWDSERHLTDIQKTGPSVTIEDDTQNFIKISIYFNGKFCIYHCDPNFRVFELHVKELDEITALVTDFFDGRLNISSFEHDAFSFNNKHHFVTDPLIYRNKPLKALYLSAPLFIYFVMFAVPTFLLTKSLSVSFSDLVLAAALVLLCIVLLLGTALLKIGFAYLKNSDKYLQVSKGKPTFVYFDGVNEYALLKSNIKMIVTYSPSGYRNPNFFHVFKIVMDDNTEFKINNMMISSDDFFSKFPTSKFVSGKGNSLLVI